MVFQDFSRLLKCSIWFILEICKTNPNATKSAALKKSIVRFWDINQINARERTGISPTRTVYISHLIFTFSILDLLSPQLPTHHYLLWKFSQLRLSESTVYNIIPYSTVKIQKIQGRHTECAYYCNAGKPATMSTESKLTEITCPSNRTIYCGSSARFGSLTMPLRLSVLTQY